MKILGASWFTPMGAPAPIGIMLVKMDPKECQEYGLFDLDGDEVSYIGISIPGNSELDDVKHIMNTGAKFPLHAARRMFNL